MDSKSHRKLDHELKLMLSQPPFSVGQVKPGALGMVNPMGKAVTLKMMWYKPVATWSSLSLLQTYLSPDK